MPARKTTTVTVEITHKSDGIFTVETVPTVSVETVPDAPETPVPDAPSTQTLFETLVEAARELRETRETADAFNDALNKAEEARRQARNAYDVASAALSEALRHLSQS
jgi:transcriptional regulator with AAA-type ATPase domain